MKWNRLGCYGSRLGDREMGWTRPRHGPSQVLGLVVNKHRLAWNPLHRGRSSLETGRLQALGHKATCQILRYKRGHQVKIVLNLKSIHETSDMAVKDFQAGYLGHCYFYSTSWRTPSLPSPVGCCPWWTQPGYAKRNTKLIMNYNV